MPFVERDSWREQYFAGIPCPDGVRIATDDGDAFDWNPALHHVYDKLHVARSQGLACGTGDDLPKSFPVFVKPRVNLKGMATRSGRADNAAAFGRLSGPDMMWTEFLDGSHLSSDFALENGRVRWSAHARGEPRDGGMFWYWTVGIEAPPAFVSRLEQWIGREAAGYTGMVNAETLGGRIIEAHLRFADQWPDLYGRRAWLEAVIGLHTGRGWHFSETPPPGYSVPLFMPHGLRFRHPPEELQARVRAMTGVTSLQVTFHEGRDPADHPMPPGGFRVAIVNGFDLAACLRARDFLWASWFARPQARAD